MLEAVTVPGQTWCATGAARLVESGEVLLYALGEIRLTAFEQRQRRLGGSMAGRDGLDALADQLSLAASGGACGPSERALLAWRRAVSVATVSYTCRNSAAGPTTPSNEDTHR